LRQDIASLSVGRFDVVIDPVEQFNPLVERRRIVCDASFGENGLFPALEQR
jgi:hypothetical protein